MIFFVNATEATIFDRCPIFETTFVLYTGRKKSQDIKIFEVFSRFTFIELKYMMRSAIQERRGTQKNVSLAGVVKHDVLPGELEQHGVVEELVDGHILAQTLAPGMEGRRETKFRGKAKVERQNTS